MVPLNKACSSARMTLQWTAVAVFLYVEIGVLVILCLPFISARRWQTIFKLGIWNKMAPFWNKGFLTMIIVLIVLFLDAVREVRKYTGAQQSKDPKLHPNIFDHMHMKLFRAQRNLYISGFSLFLWLVMRRIITLINQLATATAAVAVLQNQVESTNQAAMKYMEDNEHLKKALHEGGTGKDPAGGNEGLRKEAEELTEQLRLSEDGLKKSQAELEAMRRQKENLTLEYDRLLQEFQNLQERSGEDKKDQ
uniref:Endoplasmic reticulum transmembrane protein n=2 Tax=Scleropages formosus TaxID=113540 RepID=A0A8C9SVT2_SCLFO